MSINIAINTTLRVPHELVAAIQAASNGTGNIDYVDSVPNISAPGMSGLEADLDAAVCGAVKGLPMTIRSNSASVPLSHRRRQERSVANSPSMNIVVDSTIQVPLEVAAAMQAAPHTDDDFEHITGMEQVKYSAKAALIRAVLALPFQIQSHSTPAQDFSPPLPTQEVFQYRSRQTVTPGSRSRSRSPGPPNSSATTTSFDIHVRGIVKQFIVHAEPSTTITQLKEMIESEDGVVFFPQILLHRGKRIRSEDVSIGKITLQALGLRGGETIHIVPRASAEWDGSFEWEDGAIELMNELKREALQAGIDASGIDESDDDPYESMDESTAEAENLRVRAAASMDPDDRPFVR